MRAVLGAAVLLAVVSGTPLPGEVFALKGLRSDTNLNSRRAVVRSERADGGLVVDVDGLDPSSLGVDVIIVSPDNLEKAPDAAPVDSAAGGESAAVAAVVATPAAAATAPPAAAATTPVAGALVQPQAEQAVPATTQGRVEQPAVQLASADAPLFKTGDVVLLKGFTQDNAQAFNGKAATLVAKDEHEVDTWTIKVDGITTKEPIITAESHMSPLQSQPADMLTAADPNKPAYDAHPRDTKQPAAGVPDTMPAPVAPALSATDTPTTAAASTMTPAAASAAPPAADAEKPGLTEEPAAEVTVGGTVVLQGLTGDDAAFNGLSATVTDKRADGLWSLQVAGHEDQPMATSMKHIASPTTPTVALSVPATAVEAVAADAPTVADAPTAADAPAATGAAPADGASAMSAMSGVASATSGADSNNLQRPMEMDWPHAAAKQTRLLPRRGRQTAVTPVEPAAAAAAADRSAQQTQTGLEPKLAAAAHSPDGAAGAADRPQLKEGDRVVLQGLSEAADLNGRDAVVVEHRDDGLWEIRVSGETSRMATSAAHLTHSAAAEAATGLAESGAAEPAKVGEAGPEPQAFAAGDRVMLKGFTKPNSLGYNGKEATLVGKGTDREGMWSLKVDGVDATTPIVTTETHLSYVSSVAPPYAQLAAETKPTSVDEGQLHAGDMVLLKGFTNADAQPYNGKEATLVSQAEDQPGLWEITVAGDSARIATTPSHFDRKPVAVADEPNSLAAAVDATAESALPTAKTHEQPAEAAATEPAANPDKAGQPEAKTKLAESAAKGSGEQVASTEPAAKVPAARAKPKGSDARRKTSAGVDSAADDAQATTLEPAASEAKTPAADPEDQAAEPNSPTAEAAVEPQLKSGDRVQLSGFTNANSLEFNNKEATLVDKDKDGMWAIEMDGVDSTRPFVTAEKHLSRVSTTSSPTVDATVESQRYEQSAKDPAAKSDKADEPGVGQQPATEGSSANVPEAGEGIDAAAETAEVDAATATAAAVASDQTASIINPHGKFEVHTGVVMPKPATAQPQALAAGDRVMLKGFTKPNALGYNGKEATLVGKDTDEEGMWSLKVDGVDATTPFVTAEAHLSYVSSVAPPYVELAAETKPVPAAAQSVERGPVQGDVVTLKGLKETGTEYNGLEATVTSSSADEDGLWNIQIKGKGPMWTTQAHMSFPLQAAQPKTELSAEEKAADVAAAVPKPAVLSTENDAVPAEAVAPVSAEAEGVKQQLAHQEVELEKLGHQLDAARAEAQAKVEQATARASAELDKERARAAAAEAELKQLQTNNTPPPPAKHATIEDGAAVKTGGQAELVDLKNDAGLNGQTVGVVAVRQDEVTVKLGNGEEVSVAPANVKPLLLITGSEK